MQFDFLDGLFVFMLATFIGLDVIRRVSRLLHTPLMSLTNAISAIAVVGAILLAGEQESQLSTVLGAIAVFASTTNIVSGFLITDRMLKMFKRREAAGRASMIDQLIQLVYLVATALFIFSLKWMSDPTTARRGVFAGVGGMALAIIGTMMHPLIIGYSWVAIPFVLGALAGVPAVLGAADGGPAADSAFACVRRTGGRSGRDGEVLPLGGTCRADDVSNGRDRPRSHSRLSHLHGKSGRSGEAAGGDSDPSDHVPRAERHQFHAARRRRWPLRSC